MIIFRSSKLVAALLTVAIAGTVSDPVSAASWTYRDFSRPPYHSVEAALAARDGRALLTINCSHAGDPTLSIQYRPHSDIGLSMGPVVLDWDPPRAIPLASKLIWEPHERGATARDGTKDRDASDVAATIQATPGAVKVVTSDIEGERSVAFFDSDDNLEAIGRVLAACPWNPKPAK
jgi:hypothetical protein